MIQFIMLTRKAGLFLKEHDDTHTHVSEYEL